MPVALVTCTVLEVLLAVSLFDASDPVALEDFAGRLEPAMSVVFISFKPTIIDRSQRVDLHALAFSRTFIFDHLALVGRIAFVLLGLNL